MNSNSTISSSDLLSGPLAIAQAGVQRLLSQSASCKIWSVVVAIVVLLLGAGKVGGEMLLWEAAPVVLFGLADASYAFRAARLTELATKSDASVAEVLRAQSGELGFAGSAMSLAGALSFSVWPYYLTLGGLVFGLGHSVLRSPQASAAEKSNPVWAQPVVRGPNMGGLGFAGPSPVIPPNASFRPPTGGSPFGNPKFGNPSMTGSGRPMTMPTAAMSGKHPGFAGGVGSPSMRPGVPPVGALRPTIPPASTPAIHSSAAPAANPPAHAAAPQAPTPAPTASATPTPTPSVPAKAAAR